MKRLTALTAIAMLALAACGTASAPPQPTPSPAATPSATPAAATSPTGETATIKVTFDGETCSVAGPAVVDAGTTITWVFENTTAAVEASTKKGAKSLGSELVVIPVAEGTTWEAFVADAPPEGEKGDWPDAPAYVLVDSAQVGYGPSDTLSTVAQGYAYVVMCNLYWDYDKGTPLAIYKGALVEVLPG